jgi:hypothetical protein
VYAFHAAHDVLADTRTCSRVRLVQAVPTPIVVDASR